MTKVTGAGDRYDLGPWCYHLLPHQLGLSQVLLQEANQTNYIFRLLAQSFSQVPAVQV